MQLQPQWYKFNLQKNSQVIQLEFNKHLKIVKITRTKMKREPHKSFKRIFNFKFVVTKKATDLQGCQ